MSAKRVLDEYRWHPQKRLEELEVVYIHRTPEGEFAVISGAEIEGLERGFFVVRRSGRRVRIPYHRIVEIRHGSRVLYRKRA
ncbi:MAG: DUF504 domain-containing protein [Euryarchaeota archaeon]|nr:DUF504 domain-containing protein [Euryarchaeota archaeon]